MEDLGHFNSVSHSNDGSADPCEEMWASVFDSDPKENLCCKKVLDGSDAPAKQLFIFSPGVL